MKRNLKHIKDNPFIKNAFKKNIEASTKTCVYYVKQSQLK